MCAYDAGQRPNYGQVLDALNRVRVHLGAAPDLERLARHHVWPILEELAFASPLRHPALPEVAFLERGSEATAQAPRQIDAVVGKFLTRPDWFTRRGELRNLLGSDPSWTARPLLEQLDRVLASRARRMASEEREQLVLLLELLRARPVPEVLERTRGLLRHADPEIAELARLVGHS
jgi:hypothetical protein